MSLLLLASIALASPDREYWTDRPDALGAYMRCASKAFDDDPSIGEYEAKDRIKVECRPHRDEAIEIFVPLYQRRMGFPQPITDSDDAEWTILGAVLAEQMRREEETMLASIESFPNNGAPPIRFIPQTAKLAASTLCMEPSDDDDAIREIAGNNGVTIRPSVDEGCDMVLLSNKAPKARLPRIYGSEVRTINSALCITDYRAAFPGFDGAAATYYIEQKEGSRLTCMIELLSMRAQN